MIKSSMSALWLMIFSAVIFRILPHPDNVTPIAALALFAGYAVVDRRMALLMPLLALLLSDVLIGFHGTMVFVYIAFVMTVLIGHFVRRYTGMMPVIIAALGSSVLFFIVTNFGVWFMADLYSSDLSGLLQAYVMGSPFFRNTLLGDLVFNALFFGIFYSLQGRRAISPG